MTVQNNTPFNNKHICLARHCVTKAMKTFSVSEEAGGIEVEDLLQEAYIAMNKAYEDYDENHERNAKIETLLYVYITNKTYNEIKRITSKRDKEHKAIEALSEEEMSRQIDNCEITMSAPLIQSAINDIAAKAAPYVGAVDEQKLAEILTALTEYDFQKAAGESVGISKDMMKLIMRDFRAHLKDNPEEAELFKNSLNSST